MNPLNFSDLANETMDLGLKMENEGKALKLTDRPGLLYKKILGKETYLVKGFATENIEQEFKNISPDMLDKLGAYSEEEIKFFPTLSIELAENLVKNLLNQRFPYKEDLVRNISDPGVTSWMVVEDDGFKILLSHPGDQQDLDNLENIGVLGPRKEVARLFELAKNKLDPLISIKEFSCSDVEISLKVNDKKSFYFQALKDLFHHGNMEGEIIEYFGPYLDHSVLDFFMEISSLRGLWIELQKHNI